MGTGELFTILEEGRNFVVPMGEKMICRRAVTCVLFITALLVGCGKKAPPEPPELSAPSAVRALSAQGELDAVVLHWSSPITTATGEDLSDLRGFFVLRSDVVKGERPLYDRIANIVVPVEGDTGNFEYRDTDVKPGRAYVYQVSPYNSDETMGERDKTLRINFLGDSTTVETF